MMSHESDSNCVVDWPGDLGISAVASMIGWLLHVLGICQHRRLTFPQTLRSRAATSPTRTCLDCGREFEYDWGKMQVAQLSNSMLLSTPCHKLSVRK
jgi:hypothetical protein